MTDTQTPRRAIASPSPSVTAPDGAPISRPTIDAPMPRAATSGESTTSQQAILCPSTRSVAPAGTDSHLTPAVPTPMVQASGGAPSTRRVKASASTKPQPPTGEDSRPTKAVPTPMDPTSDGTRLAGRREVADTQEVSAASDQPTGRQSRLATQRDNAVGPARGPGQAARSVPTPKPVSLLDPALALAADVLDDIERVRIANENRLRQLTRSVEDSDGETRGFGLNESHPDVARLGAIVATLAKVEHEATLNLQRQMRRHPLGPWVKAQIGIGEKQVARLLAVIGDPYWRPEIVREDETVLPAGPRTVSALWAFCGLHVLPIGDQGTSDTQRGSVTDRNQLPAVQSTPVDQTRFDGGMGGDPGQCTRDAQAGAAGVAPKRARGTKANWSTRAKTRVYLIAESCLKQTGGAKDGSDPNVVARRRSPYRDVYDAGREQYGESIHAVDCARCGPSGKPAKAGTPLSAGHRHARAMRLVMKAILRDLWREAKRIHESTAEEATS